MPSLDGPAMYGSNTTKASDLLYEVSAWLHDAHVGAQGFEAAHDALADRLVPTADAAMAEVRRAASRVAELEQETERLREQVGGPCICKPPPITDGPEETCPEHGRPLRDWIEFGGHATARAERAEAQVRAARAKIAEWPVASDRIAAYYAERIEIALADAPAAGGRTPTEQPASVNADKMMAQMVTEYRRKIGNSPAWHVSVVGPFARPSRRVPRVTDEARLVGPWKPACPACQRPVADTSAHYVSSVGHDTHPDDSIDPHYSCTGQKSCDV